MSLSTDGIWKAGAWATTVWADGVWFESGGAPAPSPAPAPVTGGGNAWYNLYDLELNRRRRRKREREQAEEETKALPAVDREIASFLHKQEREDEKRKDLERLKKLAAEFPRSEIVPERVIAALDRVAQNDSFRALARLDRELKRMLEEEELAFLMMLFDD